MKKIILKKYLLMFTLFLGTTVGFSQVYEGDLVITSQQQITDFNDAGWTSVEGWVSISSGYSDPPINITFDNLEEIGGFSNLTNYGINTISFPELTKITETKFIIITHHALTMSRMNRLYGVTMPEKGVSQLVSVDLQKAEELVA